MLGWIGVDLDGTLAHYDGWKGEAHIGPPIAAMADRVRGWLKEGHEVRIFTARVDVTEAMREIVEAPIRTWCEQHLGQVLPITNVKTMSMWKLYDDRCIQVEANTGRLLP